MGLGERLLTLGETMPKQNVTIRKDKPIKKYND
jgi:hypothetical protein